MIKHPITYEDFNGETHTEDFYFHVTKAEIVEMEVEHKEGMQQWIDAIIAADDRKAVVAEFKKIILFAYGVKSADGKHFVKSDELREKFANHAAYSALFMQLATDADAGAAFIKGVLPADMGPEVEKAVAELEQSQKPAT